MSPLIKYVLRNLASRPSLTALIAAALVIVGITLSATAAVGGGLIVASRAGGHDNWVLVTARGSQLEIESRLEVADLNKIKTAAEVLRASPEVVVRSHITEGGALEIAIVRGLEPQGFDMHGAQLIAGRMPAPGTNEIIVGDAAQRHWPWLQIGATTTLMGLKMTCVGVFHAPGFFAGEIWTTRALFLASTTLTTLSVVYLETANRQDAERLTAALNATREITVTATLERDFYRKKVEEFGYIIQGLVLIFGLIMSGAILAAASLLSVFQQRHISEHSSLRAMGFRASAISRLILYETEFLAIPAGAIGIVITWLTLRDYVVSTISPSRSVAIYRAPLTAQLALVSFVGLIVVSLLGIIAPIIRMRSTSVTRGLREE